MNIRTLFCFVVTGFLSLKSYSQGQPIGYWRAHMPYNNAVSAATDGVTVYAGSNESFFTYNAAQNEISTYSKVEGMSDVGISYIGYDATTGYAIIAYTNGNIDLFKDETFFNIPDIKLKNISPKTINHIFTENGMAYLSTSFGVVALNLSKRETKETYSFVSNSQTIEVKEFGAAGTYLYALTAKGLYRANRNNPNLQAYSAWENIDSSTKLKSLAQAGGKMYVATDDSLFALNGTTRNFVYHALSSIVRIETGGTNIFVNQYNFSIDEGFIKIINSSTDAATDSFRFYGKPINTMMLSDNSYYVADIYYGLGKRNSGGWLDRIKPESPSQSGAFDILPYNGDVWVAHGGYDENWTYQGNGGGLSHYKDGKWTVYNFSTYPYLKDHNLTDFIALAKDPVTGDLYAASYRGGLFVMRADGSNDSWSVGSPYVDQHFIDTGSYRVSGLAFDQSNNLWINSYGGGHDIAVKTPDGTGVKFFGPGSRASAAYVLVDDNNLKWYILPTGRDGIAVYDDGGTPTNRLDDVASLISASAYGLNAYLNCIAKDKQNNIWVGSNDGIGVISCSPDQIASGTCELRKPIVQYDQFPGYLFQNEKVKTIAVDGGNRKWIGTTNGIWLISPEGDKIIYRFTAENSPLPSNNIQKIAVDPVTGDVYIGTSSGLVSFRSTATDGTTENQSVITFPNPVPSGYSGTIAIRGVSENADVRITDIGGQLIYRTKALGGQAVWSGKDYTGRRPQTGVYLIFVTNKDGSQTHVGKMVFSE